MKKLKWFFAEFLVVVTGVLMAFLLNSWWINIQDNVKQTRYLDQIEGEITETISIIEVAKDSQTKRFQALVLLVRAVYTDPEHLPSDSVLASNALKGMSFNPGSQVSATLKSMVSTGDLQLIENDSLRSLLVTAIEKLGNYDKATSQQTFQWMVSSYEKFANEIGVFDMLMSEISVEDLERASADSISFVPSPDLFKRPPSINWPELLNRPSFKRALENLFLAHSNLKRNHEEVLNEMQSFHKDFVRIRNK